MSFKAKDLQYEANEPAFLRKLRAGAAGVDPDRHERPLPRPKRAKQDEDEDDGPTYVLEDSGQSLTKAEYEALQSKEEEDSKEGKPIRDESVGDSKDDERGQNAASKSSQQTTEIGQSSRKRKAGKIIGDHGEDGPSKQNEQQEAKKKTVKKAAKRTKAVKLSFDDD